MVHCINSMPVSFAGVSRRMKPLQFLVESRDDSAPVLPAPPRSSLVLLLRSTAIAIGAAAARAAAGRCAAIVSAVIAIGPGAATPEHGPRGRVRGSSATYSNLSAVGICSNLSAGLQCSPDLPSGSERPGRARREAAEPRCGLHGGRLPRGASPGVRLRNRHRCRCATAIGKESDGGQ